MRSYLSPPITLMSQTDARVYSQFSIWVKPNFLQLFSQGGHMAYHRIKSVFVRQYHRFRLGKWEQVCQHWRSHPGQLSLFS